MEDSPQYNARLRKVRRRLFPDDGDQNEQQNIDNRFLEEMRIQLEQVRSKRFFFNKNSSNLNDY